MSTRDGGPAFPLDLVDVDSMGEMKVRYQEPGMSLRDYFAGQALASCKEAWSTADIDDKWWWYQPTYLAKRCYELADAVLAAREEK